MSASVEQLAAQIRHALHGVFYAQDAEDEAFSAASVALDGLVARVAELETALMQPALDAKVAAARIVTEGMEWTAGDAYSVADELLLVADRLERALAAGGVGDTPQ